jgi:uncharacterized protein (TIGR03437 family)
MYRSYSRVLILAAMLLAVFCCWGQNYSISTFAGQGLALGDGGPAGNARFGTVSATALARDGTLYIADAVYHQVRKVAPDGTITLFAGGAVRGYGGDSGPATSAMLDTPTALAVDSGGAVYIGESGNHRVRVVTTFGNIQTIAGNGQLAPSPAVAHVLPGEGGPATAAPLGQIAALAFASNGDLLIADSGNNRVFRVSHAGNITTVAGNATTPASLADQPAAPATLSTPAGVASDYLGNIFIAEQKNGVVRMVDTKGNMTRLIGTGSTTDAPVSSGSPLSYPLLQPVGLATDSSYNLYIVESGRISMYTPPSFATGAPASVQAIAGDISQKVLAGTGDGGPPMSAGMNPRSLAISGHGMLYIADSNSALDFHNRVRIIANNTITNFAGGNPPSGKGDKGAATSAQLYFPRAVAIDSKGNVYIADTADNRVRVVTSDGTINAYAGTGTAGTSGDQGSATSASLNPPTGLAFDSKSNLYIADGTRIRQVSAAGTITTFAGGGNSAQDGTAALAASFTQAGSLAVDGQDNLYVDQLARVSQVSAASQTVATVAGTGTAGYSGDNGQATAAQIADVAGIAVDASGNVYIADKDNGRIRKVDSTGNITTIAGGGTSTADGVAATSAALNIPLGVAVDSTGNIFIAEYGGNRVRVVGTDGNIRTIAGNGLQGFGGDGGVATNATLNGPMDVKVDAQGNVYIADSLNSSVRKLTPISALPAPMISKMVNAGSLVSGPLAPGERVIFTGSALGPNAKVTFDSTPAPVLSSSLTSTQVVVPYEVAGQTTSQVTVTTGGSTSAPFQVQIAASAPGIYTTSPDGLGQAIAYVNDGTLNSPDNPTLAGDVVTILCTGAGLLSPAVPTGVPVPATTPSPVLPVAATLNGEIAEVAQAYSLPGTIGEFAVDVRIPYDTQSNSTATVQITVGKAASQYASIAVEGQPDNSSGPDSDTSSYRRQLGAKRPLPPLR